MTIMAQQFPPNWHLNPPQDSVQCKYSIGISQPSQTEQAASKSAWAHAVQNFAFSIGTYFSGEREAKALSQGYESDIEDPYTVTVETASFSTHIQLSGIRELARKTERQADGTWIVRVLTAMSGADFQKALRYIENEEAAFLAYRFFAQAVPARAPQDYPDYYSWLRNACLTISVTGSKQSAYLEQIEALSKRLYRNIAVFAAVIDGKPSRILYDAPRSYNGIVRALQNCGLFSFERDMQTLVLTPLHTDSLSDLRTSIAAMKDASKIFVTGLERIQLQARSIPHTDSFVINQFKTLASSQFSLNSVHFNLPSRYISADYLDEAGIIDYISRNSADFPARYAVLLFAQTTLESSATKYLPHNVSASCRFTLYDVLTGEILQSAHANTQGYPVFNPQDLQEASIVSESLRALRFLYDVKNQSGFAGIMRDVLGNL
ncbi:hypothetical protein ACYULU_05315 [Breznakiellaceae bacterium SP9]